MIYWGLTSTVLLYDVLNLHLICLFTPHFSPIGDAKHDQIHLKVASLLLYELRCHQRHSGLLQIYLVH